MNKILLLILSFLFAQALIGQEKYSIREPHKRDTIHVSSYKVLRIKKNKKFYLIYVSKDKNCYQIVSLKNRMKNCSKIRKGHKYELVLISYFTTNTDPSGVTGIDVDGTTIYFDDDCLGNLFSTNNLVGKCYIEESELN